MMTGGETPPLQITNNVAQIIKSGTNRRGKFFAKLSAKESGKLFKNSFQE
jgi:hypothetical protein